MDSYFAYSSTDNFLSLIPISDWLIFCRGKLMLHKKRNQNDKHEFFAEKQNKKTMPKKVYANKSSIRYTLNSPHYPMIRCSKL